MSGCGEEGGMQEQVKLNSALQLRRLSVLIATSFVDMIGFAMILPLLPFYATRMNASPAVIGLIIASFSASQLLASPIWGRVSDRFGRRPVLIIGLAASALAYVVFGFAREVWLLFLSRVIQGAGGGTTGVAQAYVADTVGAEDRARALGWLSAATSAGVMVGPVIGSFAAHWGQWSPGLLAAGLCLVNVVFAWRWLPESKDLRTAYRRQARPSFWREALGVIRNPTLPTSRLILIYAVGMLAFTCLTSVLSLYLDLEFGFTEKNIGYIFLFVGCLSLLMRSLMLGPIIDRVGEIRAMRMGSFLLIVGLWVMPLPERLLTLGGALSLVPVGTALLFPSTTALLTKIAPRSELGSTMGIAQAFAGISRLVAPVFATVLFERISHGMPLFAAGSIVALTSILAFKIPIQSPADSASKPSATSRP